MTETEPQLPRYRAGCGIPDLRWVNAKLPIADVAKALELRFGQGGMIHCWHPEKHQHGDQTPSVSIRKITNRIKCFGCGSASMSVVDLVCDCLGVEVTDAARWIDERFQVPQIPKRKHLEAVRPLRWCEVGHEQPLELLVKSGIWGRILKPPAQRIAPVLMALATKTDHDSWAITISYFGIMRYSGVKSFGSVSKGLAQLEEIEWLQRIHGAAQPGSELRATNTYEVTPYGEGLLEFAALTFAQNKVEIDASREIRRQQRRARREVLDAATRFAAMKPTDTTSPVRDYSV